VVVGDNKDLALPSWPNKGDGRVTLGFIVVSGFQYLPVVI
jgi:hypothetical protein